MIDRESKTLKVSPESEIATLIAEASQAGVPVIIDTGEWIFRLAVSSVAPADSAASQLQAERRVIEELEAPLRLLPSGGRPT